MSAQVRRGRGGGSYSSEENKIINLLRYCMCPYFLHLLSDLPPFRDLIVNPVTAMFFLEHFIVGAVLVSIASAAAAPQPPPPPPPVFPSGVAPGFPDPRRNRTECYTIWEDGYRDYVPTYYETYVRESTSILTMTSGTYELPPPSERQRER